VGQRPPNSEADCASRFPPEDIVMLREALLGGVSRELLRHVTIPVLISH
jgi:hypothetical protein